MHPEASAIYATPSAKVGSIGVVQAVVDDSAALDAAGIKVEVFSVGKDKAMGAPGTPLTSDQRDLIRANKVFVTLECLDGFSVGKNDALKRLVKP